MKKVVIEYLYLDLNTCERCVTTDIVLDEVVKALKPALQLADYEVIQQKIEMSSEEIAKQYRFLSSPTIRVNGKDICLSIEENGCSCCSDICGADVECRVFRYEGETYEIPPKGMLANAILQTLFLEKDNNFDTEYVMPKNLKSFYDNLRKINYYDKECITMKKMFIYEPTMCCATGLCGVSVDPELLRISTVINSLKKNGIEVVRFNLSSAPQEFVKNNQVNQLMSAGGIKVLPITVLDGEIVKKGAYPTNDELVTLLGIPKSYLGLDTVKVKVTPKKSGGCNCADGGCC